MERAYWKIEELSIEKTREKCKKQMVKVAKNEDRNEYEAISKDC